MDTKIKRILFIGLTLSVVLAGITFATGAHLQPFGAPLLAGAIVSLFASVTLYLVERHLGRDRKSVV